MTRLMSLGSLMPGASSKGLSSPRSARPSGLTCWKITRPQVSGTGTPAELTAESILRVRILNFGAQFVEKIRETKVGRICNVKCLQMSRTGMPRIWILTRNMILNCLSAKYVIKFGGFLCHMPKHEQNRPAGRTNSRININNQFEFWREK